MLIRGTAKKKRTGASIVIPLAALVGVLAGVGSVAFGELIHLVQEWSVERVFQWQGVFPCWFLLLLACPIAGLLVSSWLTQRFAPEAEGHGIPEVIKAVARRDGLIRPRVSLVKILSAAVCIGTGGSVGREGPIVQIGAAFGSVAGQLTRLSALDVKVLVAAGAAAGISATFNAPLAGVVFSCEIILGSFAAESITPIVTASVLANVVQTHIGEHGRHAAFPDIVYQYVGSWSQLPTYLLLGLLAGLCAAGFIYTLYSVEDVVRRYLPRAWQRCVVCGLCVGLAGWWYPSRPLGGVYHTAEGYSTPSEDVVPPLFGVGYPSIKYALHLQLTADDNATSLEDDQGTVVMISRSTWRQELAWLLPLVFLKPLLTSLTLAGGGSGGVFAPCLFMGGMLGASFGLVCGVLFPTIGASPGLYAIVGMGAVVAGATHGVLSAILIVYEMTNNYEIILPIMLAAGLASIVTKAIQPESIYHKKLSRRGEQVARLHDMHRIEHIMVRDVMLTKFPSLQPQDNVVKIVRIARAHSHIESLPVLNKNGRLVGIIRPEDLHRILDTDAAPQLIRAEDVALTVPIAISPDANLLEALREFGTHDIDTLPVEVKEGGRTRLIGLLLRSEVMRRYRVEMLRRH